MQNINTLDDSMIPSPRGYIGIITAITYNSQLSIISVINTYLPIRL